MLKSAVKFTICVLVFVLIVDPGDLIFHLKVPLFIAILLIWAALKCKNLVRIDRDILAISLGFILIPLLGIISAVIQDNLSDQVAAVGFFKSFIIITLLVVIIDMKIALDKYLIRFCILIPLIIIPIYICISIDPNSILTVYHYLNAKDVAKFSSRDFYGYKVIMLYYRTSPLLVFPLAYYCNAFFNGNKRVFNFVMAGLFLFTLILSGTRANMLSGVVVVTYLLFNHLMMKRNKTPLVIAFTVVGIAILVFFQTLSFEKADQSSAIKSGHFDSYILLFIDHPQYLIWGEGLGSTFYTSGNRTFVSQTELTYLDVVRWFGIPLALAMFFLLLYPVIYLSLNKKVGDSKYLIAAYFGYLFIAGTNPLLMSSTGMLAIITMYSLLKDHPRRGLTTYPIMNLV